MLSKRINNHPILKPKNNNLIKFYWNKSSMYALENETISSALFANGIYIFGHHYKDKSPQGIFCANGQCSQCMVLVDGIAVKACMTKIKKNINIQSIEKLPLINTTNKTIKTKKIKKFDIQVLIIGAGPAGISAAIELGKLNIKTIIVDDKNNIGGKLVLQTHKFFGSVQDSYAGIRGFKIAKILEEKIKKLNSVEIWTNSTVIGIFSDKIIGVVKNDEYILIKPSKLLITTGAREKMLCFPGNTLPGIYGAGAFQTMINRDLIKTSKNILIVGAGNVGLITAYHAIQAGIKVVAIIEATKQIGGYKVHADKLIRMGIPILTEHTIISVYGEKHIEAATIAKVDKKWDILPNSKKTYEIDTLLIAIGLNKINEFYYKAKKWNMDVYSAGDAQEIAEASSAIFSGKIEGLKIAKSLNYFKENIPEKWTKKSNMLKSKPSSTIKYKYIKKTEGIFPIFHCYQQIPCNPCSSICPENIITMLGDKLLGLPTLKNETACKGCMKCVLICPGLAITLVDYRKNKKNPIITLSYEIDTKNLNKGDLVNCTDIDGNLIDKFKIKRILYNEKKHNNTRLIQIEANKNVANYIAGIRTEKKTKRIQEEKIKNKLKKDSIVCRCERVSLEDIKKSINKNISDLNQLKAINRLGMGSCGSKTCRPIVIDILKKTNIKEINIIDRIDRPLFIEVPMNILAGYMENK